MRGAPARLGHAVAQLGEPQEHAARDLPLLGRQRGEDAVGGLRDRRGDPAGGAVGLDCERASVAPLPGRAQRVREQRQRPGLAGHLAHGQLDQPRLEPQPRQPRRLGHRPLELVLAHRPERELVGSDRAGELGMRQELAVHVGPHPDRHRPAQPPAAHR